MGRLLRPRAPGVPFHITARIQWSAPLLSGVEAQAQRILAASHDLSDATVAAHAFMPNHLHLLVVQGSMSLDAFMQPFLRRLALLIQRRTGKEGHVFERRFNHTALLDPDYLRNTITYIHLNGARKGLCAGADDFAWCSHAAYCEAATADPATAPGAVMATMIRMFSDQIDEPLESCVETYRAFVRWRLECDRLNALAEVPMLPSPPSTRAGDAHWYATFNSACGAAAERQLNEPPRIDLRDFMRSTLQQLAPEMSLAHLRSGDSARALIKIRQVVIVRALVAGYRGRRIAQFLNVSDATVSRLKVEYRRSRSR